ncbi:U-box domain-containing protein 8 [Spatholobus suberectus]|nr:U-box domain-containing protein 8 [Spatholobus suberectus]
MCRFWIFHPLLSFNHALISPLHHTLPHTHPQTLIYTLTSPSSHPSSTRSTYSCVSPTTTPSGTASLTPSPSSLAPTTPPNDSLRHRVLSLLLNLSLDNDTKVDLVAEGVLTCLVALLLVAAPSTFRTVTTTPLTSLAVLHTNKATIGAFPRAIHILLSVVRDNKGKEKKETAIALYTICSFPNNKRKSVECGIVPILLQSDDCRLERSVEVIVVLAKCKRVFGSTSHTRVFEDFRVNFEGNALEALRDGVWKFVKGWCTMIFTVVAHQKLKGNEFKHESAGRGNRGTQTDEIAQ